MIKNLILLSCVAGLAFAAYDGDDEHKPLHEMASNIMQNLQKEHIPSDGPHSGSANAPINHLYASQMISKADKTKITVGVKGVQFVSVESNGRVVNMTTTFGVGAAAVYNVDREDIEQQLEEYDVIVTDESEKEIDETLDLMVDEYLSDDLVAKPNETKIVLAKKAKLGMKIVPRGSDKREVKLSVSQGYIVAAKTNVTKGYTESFYNY